MTRKTSVPALVRTALAELKAKSTAKDRANLARFGIDARNALGVSMANIQKIAKSLGRSHELAQALWDTGCYEARMLAAFVDEPERVTKAQMERWCRDFDNWGIVDTLCFCLFDRAPDAWAMVGPWSEKRDEFGRRAAFALLASLAGHDKTASDARFLEGLRLVERASSDERNFVKKGVSWAFRRIGGRNRVLHKASLDLAKRLAASQDRTERWLGREAQRELTNPKTLKRMGASRA
jgi:3-methyladenine DNA glycosylase AlkD